MDMSLAATNKFHIVLYVAAIVISITAILFTFLQRRTDRLQNKFFIAMLVIVTMNSINGIIGSIAEPYAFFSDRAYHILDTNLFLYFFLHSTLTPLLYFYVISVTGAIRKRSMTKNLVYATPLIFTEFLVMLNPIIRCVYYHDSDMNFHRNWAEFIIYAVAGLYLFMAMARLLL